MKKFFFFLILASLLFASGFFFAFKWQEKREGNMAIVSKCPILENKNFVLIFPRPKDESAFQKTLQSIWEQDYPHVRLICLGEGEGGAVPYCFSPFGKTHALYQVIHQCKDEEIIVLLDENAWLSHEGVLSQLNLYYQDPGHWAAFGKAMSYPDFKVIKESKNQFSRKKSPLNNLALKSFYAGLFKKIRLSDFIFQGTLLEDLWDASIVPSFLEMAPEKTSFLSEVLSFQKTKAYEIPYVRERALKKHFSSLSSYPSLEDLWAKETENRAELILFSKNNPLNLYAFLESLQKKVSGFFQVTVFYEADPSYEKGYEIVQEEFGCAQIVPLGEGFKEQLLKIFNESSSNFVLFANDQFLLKDPLDLNQCMEEMKKSHAYGFYFTDTLAIPLSLSIQENISAWSFEYAKKDPHNLDMTLFPKLEILKAISKGSFENQESLIQVLNQHLPKNMLGLYYTISKTVKIHAEISHEEMLQKLEEGFKLDVSSENLSLIPRKSF